MDVLIIGAGGAGSVVAKKCAMNLGVFGRIHLASRTLSKCIQIQQNCVSPITVSQLDADCVADTIALIEDVQPHLIINMALPYQD
ncbi:MAG: saccharopine dehydrogenase NADP-binding domain-containing protein, partial [Thermosynechococcaceae cyanobacterium]